VKLRTVGSRGERGGRAGGQVRVAGQRRPAGVEHRGGAQVDGQRAEPCERRRRGERAHRPGRGATVGAARDNARVTFARIAWLITVLACLLTCLALLLSGYQGYAAVIFAVGACAAINLLL
jgi:hypothetical protein